MFKLNKDSSLDFDGFGGLFYQTYWNVVLFTPGWILPNFNISNVILLPKTKDAYTIDKFRPIAMRNSDEYWACIINGRMVTNYGIINHIIYSSIWYGIKSETNTIKEHSCWLVCDGNQIEFGRIFGARNLFSILWTYTMIKIQTSILMPRLEFVVVNPKVIKLKASIIFLPISIWNSRIESLQSKFSYVCSLIIAKVALICTYTNITFKNSWNDFSIIKAFIVQIHPLFDWIK